MARDYDKITKEITLVGFFSEYLPPCFKLKCLERNVKKPCSIRIKRLEKNELSLQEYRKRSATVV